MNCNADYRGMLLFTAHKANYGIETNRIMTLFSIQSSYRKLLGRKSIILLFIITLSFSAFITNVSGAQVTFAWDAAASDVAGYRIHYGAASGSYTASIDAGQNTTCTVPNLTSGTTYFFAVTAYNSGGDRSGYSNEVSYTVPDEVTLSSISIDGTTQVDENSSSQYTCTAHYSDGSSAVLADGVSWSDDSAAATINPSGVFTTGSVTADTTVTITATYGGLTNTRNVAIKNIPPTVSSITISGPVQVSENSSTQFTCTAHYSDGASAVLTDGVSWSENAAAATINSSGTLITGTVTTDTSISVTAAYNGQTDTHSVIIKKNAAILSSLSISGPARLDEESGGQYSCTAHYSDNSSSTVTDSVQWSVNSEFAVIDATGHLTTRAVQSEEHVIINTTLGGQQAGFDLIISNSTKTHYSLNVDIAGSGTVVLDPPGGIYDKDTVVSITAEADLAWTFDGWIGAVADAESSTTSVVMDANIDLSVTFLQDTDLDSIPDQEEWGSDGKDMGYDGNADGIADYLQSSVASLHTNDYLNYITMSTVEPGRITRCLALETVSDDPADHTMPLGLFAFRIEDLPSGGDTTLTIYLPADSKFDAFDKHGPTLDDPSAHWYEFMFDTDSKTGAVIDNGSIMLFFKDGSRGDDDLYANGVISASGGPVILSSDETPPGNQLSDNNPAIAAPTNGSSGCFIDTIFMPPR